MRQYNFTISDNDYEVVIKEVTKEDLTAEVNGDEYVVKINDIIDLSKPVAEDSAPTVQKTAAPAPAVAKPATPAAPKAADSGGSVSGGGVVAPMPGQIIDICVSEGDNVLKGQKVLILEAMKLENTLTATSDGVVKKVLVKDGDIVSQNQTLLVIE